MSNIGEIKSLPLEGKVGCEATRMRWKRNNDCFRNLHLTTAYGGASPQGEAFERSMVMNFTTWFAFAIAIIVPVAAFIFHNKE